MSEIRDLDARPEMDTVQPSSSSVGIFPDGDFINNYAVSQVLGLETEQERSKYEDNLKTIVGYAKKEGFETVDDLKWIVKSLMDKMGTPALTEKWVTKVARYCHLSMESDRIEKEKLGLLR